MLGGVLVEKNNYNLNIDYILTHRETDFYISGNVIPDISSSDKKYEYEMIEQIISILKKRDIGLVVDISNFCNNCPKKSIFDMAGISYIKCIMRDAMEDITSDNLDFFKIIIHRISEVVPAINEFQEKSNKNILIHCYAGRNRSQMMFMSYLMLTHNANYLSLRGLLMHNRNSYIISNPAFLAILYHISTNREKYKMLIALGNCPQRLNNFTEEMIKTIKEDKQNIIEMESTVYKKYLKEFVNETYFRNVNNLDKII